MSNPNPASEPSDNKVLLSALGWVGVLCVFIFIVAVAYLPNRSVSSVEKNAEERFEIRDTVRGEQSRLVGAYEWVNQEEGIVRIPVDRAMRLTVDELRAEQDAAAATGF